MGVFDILPEPNPEWVTKSWYLSMVRGIATSVFLILGAGIGLLGILSVYESTNVEYTYELFHTYHFIAGFFLIGMSTVTCCGLFVVYLRLVYMPRYNWILKGSILILAMIFLNFMVMCVLTAVYVSGYPSDVDLVILNGIINYIDGISSGIDIMQRELHCCGINDYGDWKHNKQFKCARQESPLACGIPWSCCKNGNDMIGKPFDMLCGYGFNIIHSNSSEIFKEDIMYTDGCQSKVLEGIYNSERKFLSYSINLMIAQGLCLLVELIAIYYLKKARVDPENQQSVHAGNQQSVHAGNQQSVRGRGQQSVDIESSVRVRDQQFVSRNVLRPTPSAPIDIIRNSPLRRQVRRGPSCSEMRNLGFRQSLTRRLNNLKSMLFSPSPNGSSCSIASEPFNCNRISPSCVDSGRNTDRSGSDPNPHPTPVSGSDSNLRPNSPSGSDPNLRPNSPSDDDSVPGVCFIEPESRSCSDYFTASNSAPSTGSNSTSGMVLSNGSGSNLAVDSGPSNSSNSNLVTSSGLSNGSGSNLVVASGSSSGPRSDFVTAFETSDRSGSNLATTSGQNNGSGCNLATDSGLSNGSGPNSATDSSPNKSSGSNSVTYCGPSNGSGSNLVVASGSSSGPGSDFVTAFETSDGSGSNLATTSGPNNGSGCNLATDSGLSNGPGPNSATDSGPNKGSGSNSVTYCGPSNGSGSNLTSVTSPSDGSDSNFVTDSDSRNSSNSIFIQSSDPGPGPSSRSDSGPSTSIILKKSDIGPYSKFAVRRAVHFEDNENDSYKMIELNPDPKPKEKKTGLKKMNEDTLDPDYMPTMPRIPNVNIFESAKDRKI